MSRLWSITIAAMTPKNPTTVATNTPTFSIPPVTYCSSLPPWCACGRDGGSGGGASGTSTAIFVPGPVFGGTRIVMVWAPSCNCRRWPGIEPGGRMISTRPMRGLGCGAWPQQCEMAVGGKSEVSRPGNFARQQARRPVEKQAR